MSMSITKERLMEHISEIDDEYIVEADYTQEELARLKAAGAMPGTVNTKAKDETPSTMEPLAKSPENTGDAYETQPEPMTSQKGVRILWIATGVTLAAAAILLFIFLWNPDRSDVISTTESRVESTTSASTEATEASEVTSTEETTEETTEDERLVQIDEEHFPDSVFRAYVRVRFDKDGNEKLDPQELQDITELSLSRSTDGGSGLAKSLESLKGIEYFSSLRELVCDGNNLKELDVSQNPALVYLSCTNNSNLETLSVGSNDKLVEINCSYCDIYGTIDVSRCPKLRRLLCANNQMEWLNLSANTELVTVLCYSNRLKRLNLSEAPYLEELECGQNRLTTLDVSHSPALQELSCYRNQLTELDVSHNPSLTMLAVYENDLPKLDITNNPYLDQWYCDKAVEIVGDVENYSTRDMFRGGSSYEYTRIDPNDVSITDSIVSEIPTDETMFVVINKTNISDEYFREFVITHFDMNQDGKLDYSECLAVKEIDFGETEIMFFPPTNLKGIEYFPALEVIKAYSADIEKLDLSHNPELVSLTINCNKSMTHVDLSHNPKLKSLRLDDAKFATVDLSHNPELEELTLFYSDFTEIDVSNNPALKHIQIWGTYRLESLDVSHNPALVELDISGNTGLFELDLSHNIALETLDITSTNIRRLDLSHNPVLKEVNIDGHIDYEITGAAEGILKKWGE